MLLTRRGFFALCASAAAVGVDAQPSAYVYASESVALNSKTKPLVVGYLITRNPAAHIKAIAAIKKRTRYQRMISYRSNDASKLACVRELMKYFTRAGDLRFAARVVTPSREDVRIESVRVSQYPLLFTAAAVPVGSRLRMKSRRAQWGIGKSRGSGNAEHAARVKVLQSRKLITSGEPIQREDHDGLVELANLLTGTLYGESANPDVYKMNPLKLAGVNSLRTALGVRRLDRPIKGKWEPLLVKL